jgi:sugar lactone lactonase YvrE
LAVDPVRGHVYWSRAVEGEINRIDLAGTNPTRIIQDYPPTGAHTPAATNSNTFAPESIAIDTSAGSSGKIYWVNTHLDRIERCDLDGNNRVAFIVNGSSVAGAGSIAIDNAGGMIYWTNPTAGLVQRASLSGAGVVETVSASPLPQAIALDVAGGFVYWTNTVDRAIRRASIAGGLPAGAADVLAIGPATGERAPDGFGRASSFVSWARLGAAGSTPLPYQIKLTGATFEYAQTILVKGNQKVAAVGDAVGGVAGSTLSVISASGGPVKLTDRGDAIFTGQYRAPSIYINHVSQALFMNTDRLLSSGDDVVMTNLGTVPLAQLWDGPHSFAMSDDGSYALLQANMLPAPFVQPDYALLFQFTYPTTTGACCAGTHCTVGTQAACGGAYQGDSTACGAPGNPTTCCPANFNQINGLSVQDIFDFLNAWFAGNSQADFNHSGGLAVQDIFDFLNAWFAGCS